MAIEVADLRQVEFLAPLKDRAIKALASDMSERSVAAGQDLVTQGQSAVAFFVILEGTATVTVDGREVTTLKPGDHFGEIAMLVPEAPRTATVRAESDVRVAAMAEWNFRSFVGDHPEVHWPLLTNLARQLARQ